MTRISTRNGYRRQADLRGEVGRFDHSVANQADEYRVSILGYRSERVVVPQVPHQIELDLGARPGKQVGGCEALSEG
jgi:hypothetical protein